MVPPITLQCEIEPGKGTGEWKYFEKSAAGLDLAGQIRTWTRTFRPAVAGVRRAFTLARGVAAKLKPW